MIWCSMEKKNICELQFLVQTKKKFSPCVQTWIPPSQKKNANTPFCVIKKKLVVKKGTTPTKEIPRHDKQNRVRLLRKHRPLFLIVVLCFSFSLSFL